MTAFRAFSLALVPMLLATTALAVPATQEGADHLTQVFQTYLGKTEGLVSVKPNGDVYDLSLDASPLLALGKDSGLGGTISPIELTLTDNGDGTWAMTEDQALSFDVTLPEGGSTKGEVASLKSEGTFDEKLMSFSTATYSLSGYTSQTTMSNGSGGTTSSTATVAEMTGKSSAVANPAGGVDGESTMSIKGQSSTTEVPGGENMPPMQVTYSVDSNDATYKVTGAKADGFYNFIAFMVAHPTKEQMDADKAGLKTVVTDWLPIFGNVTGAGTMKGLKVQSPMGEFSLDEVTSTLDMNGAVPEGKARMGFTLSGLTLPAGIVPDWAVPVLPQKISLDVQATDFDPASAASVALESLDMAEGGMTDQGAFEQKLLAALLPKGNVTVTLNPGAVTGDGYELTYEGSMVAGPDAPMPTGTAKVTLAGAEKLQAALNSAPDDIKAQAMMGFGMAQGMAKQENGKLVWEIDASRPGALSVNGTPMMGGN